MNRKQGIKDDVKRAKPPLRVVLNKKLYTELSTVLNRVHETDFSLRFWELLLEDHVSAVVRRKAFLDKKRVSIKPSLEPVKSVSPPTFKEKFKSRLIRAAKYLLYRKNKKKYYSTLRNYDNILVGFPESKALNEEKLGVSLPKYDKLFAGGGDRDKRTKTEKIAESYDDIFMSNAINGLPKLLVEYFQDTYESIDLYSPECKVIHLHISDTIYNEFMIAKYLEHGARFYWYQHGSLYGETESFISHIRSSKLADQFRTWGWKIRENDVPWKAYRLESFSEKYHRYDNTYENDLLLCYPALHDGIRDDYIKFTECILKMLIEEKYKKIVARPRRSNKIQSHASALAFIQDSRVHVSTGLKPMPKAMSQTRLIVQLVVPSTNFLECIYVDHPVIGILKNSVPSDVIKPYYQFFLDQGVLHENTDTLCEHLNTMDLNSWWDSLIKHPTYRSFKNTFTRKV